MYFKNTALNNLYSTTRTGVLEQMLAFLIDRLVESNDCSCCRIKTCKDARCNDIDLCRNLIFDGILEACRAENKKGR